jgi:hemoglobin
VKHVSVRRWLVGAALATLVTGAAYADASTLYARLGGEPAVTAIASELIDRTATDPRTERSFRDSNLKRIKTHLAAQLCELTGGGCRYEGDPMREVHAGFDITDAELYAMVEILEDVMRARNVALADRNAVLALLAPMKRDVVRVVPPARGAAR